MSIALDWILLSILTQPQMNMKNTANFAIGQVLGTKAFNNGIKRAPVLDKEMEPYLMDNKVGDLATIQILKGWLFGWDAAHMNEYLNL